MVDFARLAEKQNVRAIREAMPAILARLEAVEKRLEALGTHAAPAPTLDLCKGSLLRDRDRIRMEAQALAFEQQYDVHVGCGGEVSLGTCNKCEAELGCDNKTEVVEWRHESIGPWECAHPRQCYVHDVSLLLNEINRLKSQLVGDA